MAMTYRGKALADLTDAELAEAGMTIPLQQTLAAELAIRAEMVRRGMDANQRALDGLLKAKQDLVDDLTEILGREAAEETGRHILDHVIRVAKAKLGVVEH